MADECARGAPDGLPVAHLRYDARGPAPDARQKAYRAWFRQARDECLVDSVGAATNGGWAIGDEPFRQRIAGALGRRTRWPPTR